MVITDLELSPVLASSPTSKLIQGNQSVLLISPIVETIPIHKNSYSGYSHIGTHHDKSDKSPIVDKDFRLGSGFLLHDVRVSRVET